MDSHPGRMLPPYVRTDLSSRFLLTAGPCVGGYLQDEPAASAVTEGRLGCGELGGASDEDSSVGRDLGEQPVDEVGEDAVYERSGHADPGGDLRANAMDGQEGRGHLAVARFGLFAVRLDEGTSDLRTPHG